MENETLIAENVEIDMETLSKAWDGRAFHITREARVSIVVAVLNALSPEDRNKLEEYREQ